MLDKIFQNLLRAFVVVSTFFYIGTPQTIRTLFDAIEFSYQTQELFFRYGVLFLFCCTFLVKPKRLLHFPLGFSFFAIFLIGSILTLHFGLPSRRVILNVGLGLLFYKTVFEYIDLNELKVWAKLFFGLLIVNGVFCLLQWFGKDFLFLNTDASIAPRHEWMVGLMKSKANLGVLVGLVAPWLALFSWTWFFISMAVALPLLIIGQSSCAMLALLVGFYFSIYQKSPRIFFLLAVLGVLGGICYVVFYDMPSGQFDARFGVWFRALHKVMPSSPLIGYGAGSFAIWLPQTPQMGHENLKWCWAHNEYVQLLFEGGLAMLAVVGLYIKKMIKSFFECPRTIGLCVTFGAFLSVLIISFLHFPFHVGKFVVYCLFAMAIYHALVHEYKNGDVI